MDDLMPVIKNEGKKVIAEGIETEEHIEIFRRLQGDYLQDIIIPNRYRSMNL